MIIPIIGGVAALGGAGAVCWRGVVSEEGTGPGGDWRVRWACWRWISESRKRSKDGTVTDWMRVGVFPMGRKAQAMLAAKTLVMLPPAALAAVSATVVKIKRANIADQ